MGVCAHSTPGGDQTCAPSCGAWRIQSPCAHLLQGSSRGCVPCMHADLPCHYLLPRGAVHRCYDKGTEQMKALPGVAASDGEAARGSEHLRMPVWVCRMEEMAVDVTGRFYRAMSAGREGVASTSAVYSEDSVRHQSLNFPSLVL